ncbi:hypothetical protein GALMADRAFT_205386 [Galerina marginata CBS 339.88]|uniref:Uncharacterized protein n=1 Tax=Galerina marginata (strain CBS 339.88) TaxID=685588 RepID=A0A067TTZ8_GALM3|nr:hypothetical protein GALMADRAFT_205386 [Galerina marginata CBS 339.88]
MGGLISIFFRVWTSLAPKSLDREPGYETLLEDCIEALILPSLPLPTNPKALSVQELMKDDALTGLISPVFEAWGMLQSEDGIIKFDSPWESLVRTLRAIWEYSFPTILDDWDNPNFSDELWIFFMQTWNVLSPFFALHGYTLYLKQENSASIVPTPIPPPSTYNPFCLHQTHGHQQCARNGYTLVPKLSNRDNVSHHALEKHTTSMVVTSLSSLRNPAEVWYALYDFGNSVVYPEDTVIEEVPTSSRFIGFRRRGLTLPERPYNPIKPFSVLYYRH